MRPENGADVPESRSRVGEGASLITIHRSLLVLLIRDLFHPLNHFPVQRLLNSDVSHRGRRRSAVPMLLVRRKPDHIARPNFLDWSALSLCPSEAGGDDQRLTEWMRVPGGTRTRLEGNACATHTRRFGRVEQRIDAHRAGKPINRTLS